ncbi:hypothetical protein CDAR_309721 [Caerostris darwini]|uniref:Uncharacterized protein n=1 Tax=Caerostris darwini TaxID=1538125 RepID=A0AAV4VWU4_9ARAC|nr:hypothetical protein CDAR_309721 [Caerostris darwini]
MISLRAEEKFKKSLHIPFDWRSGMRMGYRLPMKRCSDNVIVIGIVLFANSASEWAKLSTSEVFCETTSQRKS